MSSDTLQDSIANQLGAALGLPDVNAQILAKNVIAVAKSQPGEETFIRAASGFGKFDRELLKKIRSDVQAAEGAAGSFTAPSAAVTTDHTTKDRLPAPTLQRAGLQTSGEQVSSQMIQSACLK